MELQHFTEGQLFEQCISLHGGLCAWEAMFTQVHACVRRLDRDQKNMSYFFFVFFLSPTRKFAFFFKVFSFCLFPVNAIRRCITLEASAFRRCRHRV